MPEIKFTRRFCMELRRCNAMILPVVAGKLTPPGWPDRYVHHTLWAGFIEFKGIGTPIGKHQLQIIENLHKRRPWSAIILREPGWVVFPEEIYIDSPQHLLRILHEKSHSLDAE